MRQKHSLVKLGAGFVYQLYLILSQVGDVDSIQVFLDSFLL